MKIYLFLLCFLCVFVCGEKVKGVSPDEHFLYEREEFVCIHSKETIPSDRLNDDYCDCKDGSDEPGTAACSDRILLSSYEQTRDKGFFCQNRGHVSTRIANSFVNDGVCDCCDGSDEFESDIQCKNDCIEQGREERERIQREIVTHENGMKEKRNLISEAKEIKPTLQKEYDELKEQIEAKKIEIQEVESKEASVNDIATQAKELHDDDTEDYIREDEETDDEDKAERRRDEERIENRRVFEETHGKSTGDILDEQKKLKNELKTLRRELRNFEQDLESLEVLLNTDFGPDDEFLPLRGKEFITNAQGYTYKLKPFDEVLQKDTSLGTWSGWGEGTLSSMRFTGGKKCWGAGDREATIHVECGTTNEIYNVDEPSTCIYTMTFKTPAACSEEYAQKLRSMLGENEIHEEEQPVSGGSWLF